MLISIPNDISPFKVIRDGCRFAGLMNQDGRPWSLVITAFQIITINTMGITSILEIFMGNGNLQETFEALSVFAIYLQLNCKLINMLNRESDIRKLFNKLEIIRLDILKDKKNKKHMIEAENIGRKLIIFLYLLFVTAPPLSFISTSLNAYFHESQAKRLCIRIWIPWSMDEFRLYMAGNALATVLSFCGCILYSSFGCVQFTFTFQMRAYLRVLRNHLENDGAKDSSIYQRHKLYIQLINEYNNIFAGQTYLEIIVSSVMPCGFGYTLIKALKRHDPGQLDLIQQIMLCLIAPCIICPCGQLLSTEMEKLFGSSYMNDWYKEKPKNRRDLLMLMTMATKPTVLEYRMFIKYDHVCLASVFQGLYSFLMMIINIDSE